jgi:hypothetical protein
MPLFALLLLCLTGLIQAQPVPSSDAAVQRIVIQLQGAPAEARYFARSDQGEVELLDDAGALRVGQLERPPARSLQLELFQRDPGGERSLWGGLIMLGDRHQETLAFSFESQGQQVAALRVPSAPSLHMSAGQEPAGAYRLALGWGGLVLAYLAVLVLGWALRARGTGEA